MPHSSNKLSQFWQELKRRKVIKVIALYAGAAYVLIELSNNVVAPLNLPDWTPRLVIIIAVIGFPIVFVLSWIFDLSPEGIRKTVPDETFVDEVLSEPTGKRRLKVSDIVIVVLVIIVGILAFPRIFHRSANLNAMTVPVTIVNEFGEKETRRVFKKDYVSRLAIFPFENEVQDSSVNWVQGVIYDAVLEDFLQFNNIITEGDIRATHLNEQIENAKTNNTSHFLTGTFKSNNGIYELSSRIYRTNNGVLEAEWTYNGVDLLDIIDSICHQTRSDLGISNEILNSTPDLPIKELMTDNLDAYRHYIESGIYNEELPSTSFFSNLYQAIQLDSTFAYALLHRAWTIHGYQISHVSALEGIEKAMRHRHRLSEYREIQTRRSYYLITGEYEKADALAKMQYELKPYDYRFLENLAFIYRRTGMYDKLENTAYKLCEAVPDHPPYQIMLARSYLFTGKYSKGLDVLQELLLDNPENLEAMLNMAEIYLHMNDLEAAEKVINRAILLIPEEEGYWSGLLEHIAYLREIKDSRNVVESFAGEYRIDADEMSVLFTIHNNQLFAKVDPQDGFYFYPVSDSVIVALINTGDYYIFVKQFLIRNNQGKVTGFIIEQSNSNDINFTWKEDTLIQKSKELFNNGNYSEAISAFRAAYTQNPEHYYLNHFFQHLEFVQSPGYKELNSIIGSWLGEYGDLLLYTEGNKHFYRNNLGFIYEILPLSEGEFMIPSKYNALIHIVKEKDIVTGLKFVYRDGVEEYYARN